MVAGGAGVDGGAPVLRVRARLGVVQAGAHAGAVRAARAAAAGGRRVRVAGAAPARAARAAADAPREPQRQGGRAQAPLVRLRRLRGQSPSSQETLKRGRPSYSYLENCLDRVVIVVLVSDSDSLFCVPDLLNSKWNAWTSVTEDCFFGSGML